MRLELPWPPSVNNYWRHAAIKNRVIVYVSKAGKAYRADVEACLIGNITETMAGPLRVEVLLRPPTRARRDLDNCHKALLDALEHARVFHDDSQIWSLHTDWDLGETGRIIVQPNGLAVVTIEPLNVAPVLFGRNGGDP